MLRSLLASLGFAALVIAGGAASAQGTESPPTASEAAAPAAPAEAEAAAPAPPAKSGIEELTVTTQRRGQSMQDVPISVTAFDADDLTELGFDSSDDIAAQTPGLRIGFPSGEGNVPSIFLRGVGVNDFNANANGSVGWYADDVYISQVSAQVFPLFDIERVEVARGPQGTLYGRNTTGGLVNFISRRPSHTESDGEFSVSYGSWNALELRGAGGGPISDTLAGRLAIVYTDADGWIDNHFPGRDDSNDRNSWAGRGQLSFQPNESVSVLLNVHGGQNRAHAPQYEHQGLLPCGPGVPDECDALGYRDSDGIEDGSYNLNGPFDIDSWGGLLEMEAEVDGVTVTSLTAYENVKRFWHEETDASPNQLLEILWTNDSWQLSQELRFSSDFERGHWTAGVYAYTDRTSAANYADLFRALRPLIESIDPAAFPGGFDPTGSAIGAPTLVGRAKYRQQVETLAGFGQLEFDLTETLRLSGGARYTWEGRDIEETATLVEPSFAVPVFALQEDIDTQKWTWRVGLDWTPMEDVLAYTSFSRGFKSGGFNGGFAFDPAELPPFGPETLYAYEAGVKLDLLDDRLRLNLGGFYYDYSDLQVFTLVSTGATPVQVLDNASDAELYGGEVELTAQPLDGLELVAGIAFLESELKDFQSAGGVDYSGNENPLTPSLSFNGRVRYEQPLGDRSALAFLVDWSYQDEVFFDTANTSLLSEDPYWLWNARISWSLDERYEVALWGKNLLDEEYLTYVIDLSDFGFNEQMYGLPRHFGVELTYRF